MDDMLDKAINVFRKRGYHAASITELSKATNLTEGSLYKAFKNKEELFIAAFDRYCALRQAGLSDVVATESQGAKKLSAALHYYVSSSIGTEGRMGCLIVGSASSLDLVGPRAAARIRQALRRHESTFASLIEQGIADGSLRNDVDPVAASKLLWCMLLGIRVAGKAGARRSDLQIAVEQAIRMLS